MDFSAIIDDLKKNHLAARRYQRDGHGKFRDCVTVGRNGRLLFQRYNYGEAAGLVFSMQGQASGAAAVWDDAKVDYTDKGDAPALITGGQPDALEFDGGRLLWLLQKDLKSWPEGGLGRLKMMLGG